jgi:uncharacterized membrane protein YphA (DoxX/SURF4 family)
MPPSVEPQPTSVTVQPSSLAPGEPTAQLSHNSIHARAAFGFNDGVLDLVFRAGFATVFLANSWTALVDPDGFLRLIEDNFLAQLVGHYQLQLYTIAVNDLILGVLILTGFQRKYVRAWAGAWLIIVTFFKITSLI